MITNIISLVLLVIPPAITSESSWTSPDIRIVEEWSLNVLDRIEPAYTHLGTVYGVESENGFEWHTILVDKDYILHFEGNTLIDSISYSGDIWRMTFSPDCRYLLGYCYNDEKLILIDLAERTVNSNPFFSGSSELPGNPLIRVTNNGTILVKHSTYLRMYDSHFSCTLSLDDFSWSGSFITLSNAGDRFYVEDNYSIYAYDMQANLLWSIALPEATEQFPSRSFSLSNTGSMLAVTDFNKLYIYSTDHSDMLTESTFEDNISGPEFSESDAFLMVNCFTHPEVTPLRSIHSFGLRSFALQNSSIEINSEFHVSRFMTGLTMPYSFSTYMISDNGFILGFLYYDPDFGRIALLSPDMDFIWLSENLFRNRSWSFRFISDKNIRSDNSGFWYYDGESIHSCRIE
ncbi:MAG: hypothetical protein K8S24_03325 [Candidatus Aegiribacteria sp.]|nr:hypothetical protein [Candidatus Aegiribacteria sp.]